MEKSRHQTSHVAGKKKTNKPIIKTIRFEIQWKMFSKSRKKLHHFFMECQTVQNGLPIVIDGFKFHTYFVNCFIY